MSYERFGGGMTRDELRREDAEFLRLVAGQYEALQLGPEKAAELRRIAALLAAPERDEAFGGPFSVFGGRMIVPPGTQVVQNPDGSFTITLIRALEER